MNKRIVFVFSLAFLSMLSFSKAQAVMVEVSLEQLVRDADLILIGTVASVKSELTQGKIFSFVTIWVSSKIKGELEPGQNKIVVRFPGGTVGDIGMNVENSPNYKLDENVVVFLKRVSAESYFRTVASFQGKFLIENNIVLRERLPVDQFVARIENIIRSGP